MNRTRCVLLALAIGVTSCSNGADPTASPSGPDAVGDRPAGPVSAVVVGPPAPAPVADPVAGATILTTELRPVPVGARTASAEVSPPVRVEVPAVGIDAPLDQLGLGGDGAVEPPEDFDRAGWYTGSVRPGQPGPAVLAGHVDSTSGPAAFYELAAVTPGNEVIVHRADGSTVTFRVTAVEQHAKDQLAAEVVHGPVTGAELRLITCGGDFDRSSGHYRDNIVVFAVMT